MSRFKVAGIVLFAAALMFPQAAPCPEMPANGDMSPTEILRELDAMKKRVEQLEADQKREDEEAKVEKEAKTPERSRLDKLLDRLSIAGDFRIRYENTTENEGSPTRNRGVVRFRGGMNYRVTDFLTAGIRLVTGDPDDPNSSDVTLSNFADDFEVSLDRLFLNIKHKDLFLTGGKFANPFLRTDLIWDGDVNPQGGAGSYTFTQFENVTPKLTGIYFIVDHQSAGTDSNMGGVQGSVKIATSNKWNLILAGSYYDYDITSIANANAGDIRGNYLNADETNYLSDFDLVEALVAAEYRGFGERYPVRLIGDYVKNVGARVDEDEGFYVDVFVGNASKQGDYRFRYGYSLAETDAILTAFSHDNTTFSTNYRQHTVSADYVIWRNTVLNLTWYYYRRHRCSEPTAAPDCGDYVSRLRLNAVVKF